MKIEFDREADALYIQFQTGKPAKSRKIQEGIILDTSKDGRIYGLEILDATQRIPLSQLKRVQLNFRVSKLT